MDNEFLADTLFELLDAACFSAQDLQTRLEPLRLGIPAEDLLLEHFVPDGETWRLRAAQPAGVVREARLSLTAEQKQWIKDRVYERLRSTQQPVEIPSVLSSLTEEEKNRMPFGWLAEKSLSASVSQVVQLLRHDDRFVHYEGSCYGLAEWPDDLHVGFWWWRLEKAHEEGDAARFERYARKVQNLAVSSNRLSRLNQVIALFRRNLSERIMASSRGTTGRAENE
ncbi:MAG: hypothetical protein HY318_09940 [Armatimonadetes bacterium]|nr:hypothetical protein [Armatimonadota bacterium]